MDPSLRFTRERSLSTFHQREISLYVSPERGHSLRFTRETLKTAARCPGQTRGDHLIDLDDELVKKSRDQFCSPGGNRMVFIEICGFRNVCANRPGGCPGCSGFQGMEGASAPPPTGGGAEVPSVP